MALCRASDLLPKIGQSVDSHHDSFSLLKIQLWVDYGLCDVKAEGMAFQPLVGSWTSVLK